MIKEINGYLADISDLVRKVDSDAVARVLDVIYDAYKKDRTIFIFGNGGGAATAIHLACDLAKGMAGWGPKRLKALSLSDNISLITAWANDTDYNNTFGEQLRNFVEAGDVVLALSGSGHSPNVINGLKVAAEYGAIGILFSGFDGGKAKDEAKLVVLVPTDNMQQIEDVHLILSHIIMHCLKERLKEDYPELAAKMMGKC
jgi:D-sedoheptulose 7-phosphate isomerase